MDFGFASTVNRGLTLLLVRELYTLSTGSSSSFTGFTHRGCELDPDAFGGSVVSDMTTRAENSVKTARC